MISNDKPQYRCIGCNRLSDEWVARCTSCGARRSYKREVATASTRAKMVVTLGQYEPSPMDRVETGFRPWDELMGGGMIPGTTMILGGNKGLGKSTITLKILSMVPARSLLVTAEEQTELIGQRALRTGVLDVERGDQKVSIVHTSATEDALWAIDEVDPSVIVIDSMNKFMSRRSDLGGSFGSGTQMKYLVDHLRYIADKRRKVVIVIGQVRSDGTIAGPNMIQHDVDAVFLIKRDPKDKTLRRFFAVKNRFGSTDVITVARMTERGLIDPMEGSTMTYTQQMLEGLDEDDQGGATPSTNVIEFPKKSTR